METKEIIEGNKLIAEFMGLSPAPNGCYITQIGSVLPGNFIYHTSWDWLMPSWGKLSSELLRVGAFDIIESFKEAVVKNDINAAWDITVTGLKRIKIEGDFLT